MRHEVNLLEETLKALEENGKTPDDVKWVGIWDSVFFSWAEFATVASFRYNASYGLSEISRDLVVVGFNWWLERAECDHSEWWEFKMQPNRPEEHREPTEKLLKA